MVTGGQVFQVMEYSLPQGADNTFGANGDKPPAYIQAGAGHQGQQDNLRTCHQQVQQHIGLRGTT